MGSCGTHLKQSLNSRSNLAQDFADNHVLLLHLVTFAVQFFRFGLNEKRKDDKIVTEKHLPGA